MSYTLIAGQPLTVSKAFTAIMLFSQRKSHARRSSSDAYPFPAVQEPMTALPGQVFALLHAYVSMQRIESFLREDEVPDWASSFAASAEPKQVDDIGFMNATFEWYTPSTQTSGNAPFRLGPLDLRFPKGKLTLIAGATGAYLNVDMNVVLNFVKDPARVPCSLHFSAVGSLGSIQLQV